MRLDADEAERKERWIPGPTKPSKQRAISAERWMEVCPAHSGSEKTTSGAKVG